MERQTITRRIAGRDIEIVVCQLKGGYGCTHKRCNGTAKNSNGTLRTGDKMYKCEDCGKLTHASGNTSGTRLCPTCDHLASLENEHNDGSHDEQANPDCADCVAEFAASSKLTVSDEAAAPINAAISAVISDYQALESARSRVDTFSFVSNENFINITCSRCAYHTSLPRASFPLAVAAAEVYAREHANTHS